ncbi:vacuolar protein sorting-associated protein 1 [Puccinia graminis f. sp. tritici CRL 75-36-700-3]|uniref:Vacuolar protein sorting-associated protein 1 n=1 Tax=Puccinia graminis f. sp. tritici (strain CRL 75-36-700-3 / race SCCL) TaxID=418459 RepID=E3KZX9_PUCGT|nr:vacuolar protein sorting-associated protein 1 [Puccinia graminis f. sp. tritici CRL 75-36-700-3]EFP89860.2 vacuolar protein sorting-associated protein 1 [Puccinia graminis f. sp. tritici CRL 75-36-700-3]
MAMDQSLIKTINKLQDAFSSVGVQNPIDLPQIAVIGSQSSGKSSVLENLVGRDFLPRGTGIVTRRPLVLQLINRPATAKPPSATANGAEPADPDNPTPLKPGEDSNQNPDEWGEFLHKPGEKFFDFNKIRDEIVRDTETKTGKNGGISPLPINLRVFSPHVPVGDQPRDIEKQIKDMLFKFITKPNSIILAVTAANTDLANSDGLKLAREVDPEGSRTIGVLTKVDLMDQGTDVVDILAGRIIPLRLGYVPVVNRGQRDIEQNKKITAALDNEKDFFENHSSYRSKSQYCGTPFLAKKLNMVTLYILILPDQYTSKSDPHSLPFNKQILMHHIRNTLPEIKNKIGQSLAKYQAELTALGGQFGEPNSSNVVLSIITEFCSDFRTVIDGNSNDLSINELSGGARIAFVFHELFSNGVKQLDPYDQVKDGDIRTILYNSSGSSPALFVGTTAFEVIVKQQIKRLEDPALKCSSLVYDELIRILTQLLNKNQGFKRYPALKERFYSVVVAFYKKAMLSTNKFVSDLVAAEATYINTGHPDFISGHKAMALVNAKIEAAKPPPPSGPATLDKAGKLPPGAINNGRDLDVDMKQDPNSLEALEGRQPGPRRKSAGSSLMEPPPQTLKASGTLSEREVIETDVIKLLISSYFNIVKRTVIDMVPKAIMLKLVAHSKDDLQRELLSELYRPDVLDDLMKESEVVVNRRKECIKMIGALEKANEITATV